MLTVDAISVPAIIVVIFSTVSYYVYYSVSVTEEKIAVRC